MVRSQCPLEGECLRLSIAEADYNRLFNLSLDLLCIAGADGYFKRVNPSWTRVLGWTEAELLERPIHAFMHPEDRERTLAARQALFQGKPVRGLENRYLCKDGTHRWLAWQSSFASETGSVFGVARDVTDQRKVDQERLVVSKLEATGILAGGVAHDFNNLLAGILLSLEMVELLGVSSEQELYLRQAKQAIDTAKGLTQQLITFADRGSASLELCDLKALLCQTVEEALSPSDVAGVTVIAPDLWQAEVDLAQIRQVIHALVMNAREAMSGAGTIRLRAENTVLTRDASPELLAGEHLRITISDEGAGITPEVLPKIFDPYFSTKRRGDRKGMGLGLTICRSILRRHGGSIAVDSQPGQGTTVVCHLPAVRMDRGLVTAGAVGETRSQTLGRILVLNDDAGFRELVGQTLNRLGYEPVLSRMGEEGLALFQRALNERRPFSAVLLDLNVRNGGGGFRALQALQERDPGVRAVLVSDYSNEQAAREHLHQGFRGVLPKPFSSEALRVLLARVLKEP